ncbi:MAG: alpha-E domain-containing protein [Phycisphaerales bacterium]|nr:alpha-E domain-containing protein [Planctomycetota bacterium]MCH8507339.1 alpha-E domain-containing protein [Phycisphaerales bacterium]
MLSRAANAIYWMNRYLERADNVARFINVNLHLMLDLSVETASQWMPLVVTTGGEKYFREHYGDNAATQENVLQFLIYDKNNPNSIASCVRSARENARSVRQSISSEMWETVNKMHLSFRQASADQTHQDAPYDFLEEIKNSGHLFIGLTESTMSNNEAWHWARLGRLLERADQTSRIVDVKYYFVLPTIEYVGMPYDNLHWAALLKSATAFEMYRKRYRRIAPKSVAEFLLLDREFPRSIHYCLVHAEHSLHAITGSPLGTFQNPVEQRLGRLRSDFDFARIEEIIDFGLHEYLDNFQSRLIQVGETIYDDFFAVEPPSQSPTQSQSQSLLPATGEAASQGVSPP